MEQNVVLAPYTTLGIGGPARYFCTVESEADLCAALAFARAEKLQHFVLGGGSNLLLSDAGFEGLVLRIAIQGMVQHGSRTVAAAGVSWDSLVDFAIAKGLAGIECLAGIPGTVGGTPVQNVGAYGQEVAETITRVRACDLVRGEFVDLSHAQCGFAYRTSLFNVAPPTGARGRYLVTEVEFQLRPQGEPTLKYAELARRFAGEPKPSLQKVAEAVREIRAAKGMVTAAPGADGKYPAERDPDTCSAGSFFRNPVVDASVLQRVVEELHVSPESVPHWPMADGGIKLPAAWLIERAGFAKGFQMGAAAISSRHTLALTNCGGATAAEIVALRDRIASVVQRRFGVKLEQEPVSIGIC